MTQTLLSLIVAFAAYSILNISQATQKIGLGMIPLNKKKGVAVWITGTLFTSVSVFLVLYAVSIGSVSLVGAMAGTGLASLAVFSALVMKERISRQELLGIIVILIAAVMIGSFSKEMKPARILLSSLFLFLGLTGALYLSLWIISYNKKELLGLVIGGFSGALGGFVPLFQKVSTAEVGRSRALFDTKRMLDSDLPGIVPRAVKILSNPYALLWILLSIASMVVLQFALTRGKAIRTIPAFSANYILVPILGGMICFGERLHPLQWLGLLFILSGVLLLTVKPAARRTAASVET